ncbi:MAG: Spo0E family sporulation regulatory protein-aspartic acid phosphatase [Limnochordia bacterium]|jgi:hypothetical protein|nr:Spo0E family sporulation regulatory protein-aspartic acid phosphatase [Limnochordia bacterium]
METLKAQKRRELERIRQQLENALSQAGGNHQDPRVQKLSQQFDKIMMEYVRLIMR